MYDLIIIGSGPAGLGAAIYGKRAGYSTLVLEKNPMSGGQVLNTCEVDNYLGLPGINGFDLGMQFREHADRLGTEFVEADVTGIKNLPDCKKVLTSAGEFTAKAVIIAAGAEHKKLGVPGEKRLADRGIELTDAQLERLNDGAQKAGQKGIRDSLVIVDNLAFIVNVPNKTVVTAMDSRETEENVFTNINGAVIM